MPYYFETITPNEKLTKNNNNSLDKTNATSNSISKWNTELSPPRHTDLCVHDVLKICFKTTADSSVQWLQNRILHKILIVNFNLKKINIKTNDHCIFL